MLFISRIGVVLDYALCTAVVTFFFIHIFELALCFYRNNLKVCLTCKACFCNTC